MNVPPSESDRLPPNRLGIGEQAAIIYAVDHPGCVVGLDDRQARLLAGQLNLDVIGTIGILLKARQSGLIPSARYLLDALQTQGFRISVELYNEALKLADERGS